MKWNNPEYFILLFVTVLGLGVFYIYSFQKKSNLLRKFCEKQLENIIIPDLSKSRQFFRVLLVLLSISLIVLSLCRPLLGFKLEEIKRKGVDILVAIDVSSSMLAQDVKPNRLERARREVVDLLRLLQGDRVGLVAFAGIPYLQCPLTLDYGAIQLFLNELNTDLIPIPGTTITQTIQLATDIFSKQGSETRALILITDGEDHGGNPIEAAKEAKKAGIRIFTIGIGKEGGAPIPQGKKGGFVKDSSGNLILTKLDEDTLKKIALETNGTYVRSVTGDMDLEKIYLQEIRQGMEQVDLKSTNRKRWTERFQWPLGLGVLLLLLDPWVSERKKRK